MGWPAPRWAAGPVRIIKADVVGNGHVRAIVSGDDGGSLKAVAFRQAETALGQALLGAPPHRRLWLAGRVKIDDWGARPACRSEEHTSELQSLKRISYAVLCFKKKNQTVKSHNTA